MSDIAFKRKTVRELHIWTWIAILIPGITVFGAVILWTLGFTFETQLFAIIISAIVIGFAVLWWWWAVSVVGNLTRSWASTQDNIKELIEDVRDVREELIRANEREELLHLERKQRSFEEENNV